MLELSGRQRGILADKLPDTANVAAGVLVFGQLLGDYSVSPLRLMLGAGFWAALIVFAVVLARKELS